MTDTPTQQAANAPEEERILNDERMARAQEFWRRMSVVRTFGADGCLI
jgi:hypothetical protein